MNGKIESLAGCKLLIFKFIDMKVKGVLLNKK